MSVIDSQELKALSERVISSGELGRSKTYSAILGYLVDCSIEGVNPKEMAIAIDVLGRGADFDVGKDSIVRVHIYHLRNKLKAYFTKHSKTEKFRIEIPKGQYIIVTSRNEDIEDSENLSVTGKALNRRPYTLWLAVLAGVLLVLNLVIEAPEEESPVSVVNPYVSLGPWQNMLDDDTPVLILIGDYYIMGELDAAGNVARMVREFDINSLQELETLQNEGEGQEYFNLDLSYIPTGAAFALSRVRGVFGFNGDRINVKMMSELTTADLVANHIIYLGYLSGLNSLLDLVFAASDLSIGVTYDELFNLENEDYYSSSSGLSVGENSFRDYGMLSTFPSLNGNQFVMIAGMRDEGLENLAQEVTNIDELQSLEESLGIESGEVKAYEALYEVVGFDNTNFDADLVYAKTLDTEVIWEARLMGSE